jgi:hypothetical protein
MTRTPHQIYSDDKIEKNEMRGTCSTYGERRMHTGFRWENLRDRNIFEYPKVVWKIILRYIFRKYDGGYGGC